MGNVVTLKDKDKQSIYPITHISAVVDDNGNTVTELIDAEKTRAEGVESTLDSKITTEANRAKQAEQTNANSISSEVQRATKAEKELGERIDEVEDAIEQPIIQQTETTVAIAPNVLNLWGEVASLDITLAEGTAGVVNEYMFQFTSGATATTLVLPADIKWVSAPNIQANKTYQVSIINNLGVIGEFGDE
jgi:hypothetical protein